jgi:predicted DCC family thiol-disulfide oxidoreductase YuxK
MSAIAPIPVRDVQGCIFYDASCGFCARWIPFWRSSLARRGIVIAPLQSRLARRHLGLSQHELLRDLQLLLATDERIQGADVYRFVMRRIWWACPMYFVAIAPGLSRLFDGCYRLFATHRYRISRACRMPRGSSVGSGCGAGRGHRIEGRDGRGPRSILRDP